MHTPNPKAWIKTATRIVNQAGRRAFAPNELHKLLGTQNDRFLRPALNISFEAFLEILISSGQLSRVDVKPTSASSGYRVFPRYVWKDATGIDIALSLRKNSYLSHGTAARLHKLTNYKPNHIYVNKEQSPKARQESSLTQETIDRAFKNAPRTTQYVYKHMFILASSSSSPADDHDPSGISGQLPSNLFQTMERGKRLPAPQLFRGISCVRQVGRCREPGSRSAAVAVRRLIRWAV